MLTVYMFMFSIKTCSLYLVTCVTLFYTHLQQDDINPAYTSELINENTNVNKGTRTNPKQQTKSSEFVLLFFAISPSVVAHQLYPISHRDTHTRVTCMWGHGGRSGTNVEAKRESNTLHDNTSQRIVVNLQQINGII